MIEKIKIRRINKSDIKNVKAFQKYINTLVDEHAMLARNTKVTLNEEKEFLDKIIRSKNKEIFLGLFCGNTPIGIANISQEKSALNHIGTLGISIAKEYRGQGYGKKLMMAVIDGVKQKNKQLKIIQLRVYTINKPAIALYKKFGFIKVAKLPKQIQYKGRLVDEFIMNKHL